MQNVVFSYGTERFIKTAAEIGMDGLILPDVPFEEKEEFDVVCKQYGLDLISLIAPTSHERIAMIAKEAEGFVYCVSSLGVTGMRTSITTDIGAMVKLVKAQKDIPCAVGFGISTPEQDKKNGRSVGRCHCRICHCEALWCLRQRLRAEGEGLCERDEGCDQINFRLKSEHRSQSVIKICFIQKKVKQIFFVLSRFRRNYRKDLLDS